MNILSRLLSLVLLSLSAGMATAIPINLVQNPGFEQGAAGWNADHFQFVKDPLWAHSGTGAAKLTFCPTVDACLDEVFSGAYVSQLIDTTPGEFYDLSFWVRSFNGDSHISVFWDGVQLAKTATPNGPMIQYSFSGLTASAGASLLEVHGSNLVTKYLSFDDFSLLQVPAPELADPAVAISEPCIYPLMLAALGALVFVRRRWR